MCLSISQVSSLERTTQLDVPIYQSGELSREDDSTGCAYLSVKCDLITVCLVVVVESCLALLVVLVVLYSSTCTGHKSQAMGGHSNESNIFGDRVAFSTEFFALNPVLIGLSGVRKFSAIVELTRVASTHCPAHCPSSQNCFIRPRPSL
jgi:hypothetical protein